ncbi:MAG: hypothetical protein ACRCX4_05320, partial [Bacteroidales bacterium]
PLISKRLSLYVRDRNEYMEANPYEKRFAYMIVTPKNVTFDDLFDQSGELKLEYQNTAKLFGQDGLSRPPFESEIPAEVLFKAGASEQRFAVLSGPEALGSIVEDASWLVVDFNWTEEHTLEVLVKAEANTSGKRRSQNVSIIEWVEATQSEEVVYEFIVTQEAK